DQGTISRHRLFLGVRFIYYHMFITAEGVLTMDGKSAGEIVTSNGVQTLDIKDSTTKQFTFSLSFGWNY
ncbi:hypothetical protein KKF84_11320, partial [Myxococcota bacterium]|nr:hypothetical protein [Myxococcota bacterium]